MDDFDMDAEELANLPWSERHCEHEHEYDDATSEPCVCPVQGCWFNDAPCDMPSGMVQDELF